MFLCVEVIAHYGLKSVSEIYRFNFKKCLDIKFKIYENNFKDNTTAHNDHFTFFLFKEKR